MSKKMLKRSLALGALMAFVITGQAWAGSDEVNKDLLFGEDTTISDVTSALELSHKTVIEVNSSYSDQKEDVMTVDIANNATLTVKNEGDNSSGRIYAITTYDNSELVVNGNLKVITNAVASNDTRAIRSFYVNDNNGGSLTVNGNLYIAAKSEIGRAAGLDIWRGKVTVNGNMATIVAERSRTNDSNLPGSTPWYSSYAVQTGDNDPNINKGSTIIFNTDVTELTAKTNSSKNGIAHGVLMNESSDNVVFNSDTVHINVSSPVSAMGIAGFGTAVFEKGEVDINVVNSGNESNFVKDAVGVKSNLIAKDSVDRLSITVSGAGEDNNDYNNAQGTMGLYASKKRTMDIAAQTLNVTVNANNKDFTNRSDTHGIIADYGGTVNVTSKNINVTVNDSVGEAYGVLAGWNEGDAKHAKGGNGNITLGGDESIVTVKVTAKDATGIMARGQNGDSTEGSSITVNGSLLDIDVDSTGGKCAAGIFVSNGTESVEGNGGLTKVIVNSETTTIDAVGTEAEGIATMSEGSLFVNSNITVNSETNAIYTRGNAKTYINFDENGNAIANRTTVLNGDIAFGYDEDTSGTPIDADVKVNLDGEGSSWSGDTTMYNGDTQISSIEMQQDGSVVGVVGDNNNNDDFKVSKFTLNVSNGAKWTTGANSFVNTLNLDEGVVEMNGTSDQKVLVGTTTGEGTVVVSNSNAQMIINDSSDTVITAATKVEGIDNMSDEEITEALRATQNKVVNNNATSTEAATYAAHYGESALYDEVKIAMEDLQGENAASALDKTIASTNVDISDMAALGMMSWRAEMNDMNKRMGELRNANGEHGVWVRMVRGEDEYNNVKTQYNQYQLGYDEKLSVDKRWTVGMALSYTDGETSFAKGSGENTNKALSIYGSKLNNDGTFVDLIAKYARLENDFKAYDGIEDADYSTNGYSVSAEFGKRIEQGKGLWIEPQVELSYGKVSAVDYLSKAGVKVAQDSMESLVGRVGFSLGKDIKQGNVYARASYLYDFDGETSVTLNGKETLEQDLGGGWWEVGVGANINLSKATYIYADVEKTFGGEVDTNWQWNLGVRYSF